MPSDHWSCGWSFNTGGKPKATERFGNIYLDNNPHRIKEWECNMYWRDLKNNE